MLRRSSLLAALAIASACASTASAQHAGFVLFGQPTEGVKDMDPSTRFVHPVTSPYFSENSFITSDVRFIAMFQSFPDEVGPDDAQIYDVQLRLALTNQVQALIYKAGYSSFSGSSFKFQPGTGNRIKVNSPDGWNDFGIGLKWNFLQDWGNNLHAAVGVGYEFGTGDAYFQNDDELRVWLSVDKGFGPWHVGGTVNYRYGNDDNGVVSFGNNQAFIDTAAADAQILSIHLRTDYYVNKWFSPLAEFNAYIPVSTPSNPFGTGLGDLGNRNSSEKTYTLGVGAEVRPIENLGIRAAYEFSVGGGDDLFGNRVTVSAVYSF
jgi:opacity protein-like surface antigen